MAESWQYTDIINTVLCSLYLLLFVLIITIWIFRLQKDFNCNAFVGTFSIGVFLRSLSFLLQALNNHYSWCISPSTDFIISTAPAFLLFTSFMYILILWGETYKESYEWKTNFDRKFRWAVVIGNFIMYLLSSVLFILDFKTEKRGFTCDYSTADGYYQKALLILISILYITTTIGFFIYGYCVFKNNYGKNIFGRTPIQITRLKRMGMIGAIICLCFLIRACLTSLQIYKKSIGTNPWSVGPYFLVLDIFPLHLMVYFVYTIKQKIKMDFFSSDGTSLHSGNIKSPLLGSAYSNVK